jgi:uncharacterized protein (DUF488 family)
MMECAQMQGRETKGVATAFFTIGYQAHTVDSLIQSLLDNTIQVLIDVRQNPCSRKAGFSKRNLGDALTKAGLAYVHEPSLGTPRRIRDFYRSSADIPRMLAAYDKHLSSNLGPIEALAQEALSRRVCLMCLERDHNMCHRGIIAQKLCEMTKWQPIHLM